MDLNAQVTYIYSASNKYLKFFLWATTLRKWHVYEIILYILMRYQFINISIHLLHKVEQVYFFDFLFIMQLRGTRSNLVTL